MIRERQFEIMKPSQVNQHLLCAICREVFFNPMRATCGHTYCGTCLVRWIQMKKTCPLCRHKLDRNYRFDKDILATKLVGDLDVKCLRCQLWEGTLAQFKQHKKSECTFVQTNNSIPVDAIQIGDDDQEFTFAGTEEDQQIQQILENIGQPVLPIEQVEQIDPIKSITQHSQNDEQVPQNLDLPEDQFFDEDFQFIQGPQVTKPQILEIQEEQQNPQQQEQIPQPIVQDQPLQIEQQISEEKQVETRIIDFQENCQKEQIFEVIDDQQLDQKALDPEIQIIEPPLRILNNKEVKQFKSTTKFKINILKSNTITIKEPIIEKLTDEYFIEFVNHMKNEMIKKLSDIEYYNTLIG